MRKKSILAIFWLLIMTLVVGCGGGDEVNSSSYAKSVNSQEKDGDENSNESVINGTVTLPSGMILSSNEDCYTEDGEPLPTCNAVFVDFSTENGEFLGSVNVETNGSYTIYFRELATSEVVNTNLRFNIKKDGLEENYYLDFGADHLVGGDDENSDSFKPEMNVEWVDDGNGGNRPNINSLMISSQVTTVDLALDTLNSDKFLLRGTVKVPDDFTVGNQEDSNGESIGWNMIMLTAINSSTGAEYRTEIGRSETSSGNHTYPFELKVPNTTANYIIRIEKNANGEWQEMYLDDEKDVDTGFSDHTFDNDEKVINAMGVERNENSEGQWIPDISKTGYFSVSENIDDISIDIATFGNDLYKIRGEVSLQNDFDLSDDSNYMNVEIFDANTKQWLGYSSVTCDGGVCSYSVMLNDTLNNYDDNGNGGYLVHIWQEHWDQEQEENSWSNGFFLDFGTDKAIGGSGEDLDTIKNEMDISWDDVNPLHIESGTTVDAVPTVDIDFGSYIAPITYTVSGTISGIPSNAKWIDVHLYNPENGTGRGSQLETDGSFRIQNVKAERYILEVGYDIEENGEDKHYQYTVVDDDGDFSSGVRAISQQDVRWIPYDSEGNPIAETEINDPDFNWESISYSAPEEKSGQKFMLNVTSNIVVNEIIISQPTLYSLITNLTNAGNNKNININLFVPNTPIGEWKDAFTDNAGSLNMTLNNLKESDNYQLQIWIEGLGEYWYNKNKNGGALDSDVYWVGKQNGTICSDRMATSPIDSCNWNVPVEWGPNIEGFAINADSTFDLAIPNDRKTITATLALGSDYANKHVDVNMWQYNSTGYAWDNFLADASGNVEVFLRVKDGTEYRMEIYSSNTGEGFVVDLGDDGVGGANDALISNQNSWKSNGDWGPKSSTLIDITSDVALGTLTPPSLNSLTFTVNNLDAEEEIFIDLEGINSEGMYGRNNISWSEDWTTRTYSATVTIKVPNGEYRVMVHPQNHQGGLVNNGDDIGDEILTGTFNSFSWDWDKADKIAITENQNYTIDLPSSANFKSISGRVSGITGGDMSGWIDVWSPTAGGNGAVVASDGTFEVKGLTLADDYIIEYWSWLNSETIQEVVGDFIDNVTKNISKSTTIHTINGTVTNNNAGSVNISVLLLDVTDSDSSWEVINDNHAGVLANGATFNYLFTSPPPLAGHSYAVAVGIKTVNTATGETTFVIYEATKSGNTEISLTGINNSTDSVSITETETSN